MKILNKKTALTILMMLGGYNMAAAKGSEHNKPQSGPTATKQAANISEIDGSVSAKQKKGAPF